jgi:hypothetical protein
MKAKSEIRVVDDVIRIAPQLLSQIIHMTKVDIPKNSRISARTILKIGVGLSGGLCLGWVDTKGFHMVGAKGKVAAAASIGADVMAGLHYTRKFVKAVLGISNICVEMVFELPELAKTGVAGTKNEVVAPEDVPGTQAAEAKAQGTSLEELLLEETRQGPAAAAVVVRAEQVAEAKAQSMSLDSPKEDRGGAPGGEGAAAEGVAKAASESMLEECPEEVEEERSPVMAATLSE